MNSMVNLTETTVDGRTVVTIALNRPESRNALSVDLLAGLHAVTDALAAREGLGAVVLTGAGRVFCAGMDLKAVLGNAPLAAQLLRSLADLTLKLRALPAPTVARVNGAAIGGGCGLATVCDFAVTHADSKMGFPEVDLGVCPAVVAPWLVRKIGAGPARAVLLRGGLMSGHDAHAVGIVSHLAPTADHLDAATDALVATLCKAAPHALAATKKLLNELDGSTDAALVRRGADLSASVLATDLTQAMLRKKLG